MENYILYILKTNLFAAIIISVVLIIARWGRRRYTSQWKYFIWVLIAVILLVPFNLISRLTIITFEIPQQAIRQQAASPDSDRISAEMDNAGNIMAHNAENAEKNAVNSLAENVFSRLNLSSLWQGLFHLWLAGAVVLAVYRFLQYRLTLKGLLRWGLCVSDEKVLDIYQETCRECNIVVMPVLMISSKLQSPILAGLKNTCLYLPDISYDEQELKLIFMHELFHYRHRDLWYKMLLLSVRTIYWFNPLLYMMTREADKDIEYLCDSRVVAHCSYSNHMLYNRLLLKTVAAQSNIHYLFASLNDGTAAFKERVLYMMNLKFLKKGIFPALILTLVLVLSNVLVGCTAKQTQTEPDDSETITIDQKETDKPETAVPEIETATPETETSAPETIEPETSKKPESQDNEQNQETKTAETASQPVAVQAAVQVYEGNYYDTDRFRYNDPEIVRPEVIHFVKVTNVTDTSFDFAIYECPFGSFEEGKIVFLKNTAVFIGDGTEAAFYGKQYTLKFTFPNGYSSLPVAVEMQISGFGPVEGVNFDNPAIPGFEHG